MTVARNLAGWLEREGVFLLDFDLEAPGIDEFDSLRPRVPEQKGLVEYLREYVTSGRAPLLPEFAYPIGERRRTGGPSPFDDAQGVVAEPEVELPYHDLYVMRAGRRDVAHRKFIGQHDWEWFYRFEDGWLFFENLRTGVRREFNCDYMVVDCRTGLTEIGGVCLGHLADAVVLVFQPTTAHEQGLVDVVRALRDREQREGRSVPRLYVASKVPMPYEDAFDKDACKLADELVKRCEGTNEVDLWPNPATYEAEFWKPRAGVPMLTLIRAREHVAHPHDPDAYVVQWCPGSPEPLSEIEAEYAAVVDWIETARRAAAAPARPSV